MAIYTRNGVEVAITAARMIPVWIETGRGEIRWHYSERKPRKGCTIEEQPIWFYQGRYQSDSPAPRAPRMKVCDGKWVCANGLVADDGWREIQARLNELAPDVQGKHDQWNKVDAPTASHFFPPVNGSEIA